ncbi:MAG: NAD(P)-dependent oxidoreductase [Rhodobacteraceae bacterium]|nr:MAG: NAD(P)-dependent oxidoreductase [Paracoccaceae bacterium]
MKTILVFGYGYTARVIGQELRAEGWRVIGTTRSPDKAATMKADGIEAILWPDADITEALSAATHILLSAAPSEDGDPILSALRDEIRQHAAQYEWVGYLSTTAVYGDRDGGWVDETSTLSPATRRGQLRADAEQAWLDLGVETGLPIHIFRLAGIYGPGRGPFAKVRAGTARRIIKKGQVFSRTHVEDIAQVLRASIAAPNAGAIYNVCDNDPAPPQEVIAEAAQMLNLPLPEAVDFETAEMTPMARSFYAESKKVSNRKILEELGITLKYPDYRSGLKALLTIETS